MLKHNVVARERLCVFIEGGLFTNYFYSYYWSSSPDVGNDYISEHKRPNNIILGVNFGTGVDIKLDSRMHLLVGTRHDIFGIQLRPKSESTLAYSRFMIGASYSLK